MPATVSPGGVFDHVAIAVSDLVASERFYGTVLSVLGVEPSHADAELVEWEDWDIVPTDREHAVTRGLHVGFRAPTREAVDAFWQVGIDAAPARNDPAAFRRSPAFARVPAGSTSLSCAQGVPRRVPRGGDAPTGELPLAGELRTAAGPNRGVAFRRLPAPRAAAGRP
jgi:catechol 2,3-dioxygenase-like lactoylglutathione lyase family enzyme